MIQSIRWFRALVATAAWLVVPLPVAALPFFEAGDAGDLVSTANITVGTGAVTDIIGALSAEPFSLDLVDLYEIFIPNPATFTADTGTGADPNVVQDPMLFLFNFSGVGVYMNDDGPFPTQSHLDALPGGFGPGFYYLGISFAGVEPVDAASNSIFDTFTLDVLSTAPLAGWVGQPLAPDTQIPGKYDIALTGARFAMPEPATLLLVLLGLTAVSLAARRRDRS